MMRELLRALHGPVMTFIERALVGALHIMRDMELAWVSFADQRLHLPWLTKQLKCSRTSV